MPRPRSKTVRYAGRVVREHIAVFVRAYGKWPPKGWDVHHIDGDALNNDADNLVAVPKDIHRWLHGARHPRQKACVVCRAQFAPHITTRGRQQTCGLAACKSALLRQRRYEHLQRRAA